MKNPRALSWSTKSTIAGARSICAREYLEKSHWANSSVLTYPENNRVVRLKTGTLSSNDHCFKKGYTKAATDWKIALSYSCRNREEALYLERFIKRMKSKTFIKKIIDKPEILADILANK